MDLILKDNLKELSETQEPEKVNQNEENKRQGVVLEKEEERLKV